VSWIKTYASPRLPPPHCWTYLLHPKSTSELISFGFSDYPVRSLVSVNHWAISWVQTKNDFTFWLTFGLSQNLGLGESLSVRLIQKVKWPIVTFALLIFRLTNGTCLCPITHPCFALLCFNSSGLLRCCWVVDNQSLCYSSGMSCKVTNQMFLKLLNRLLFNRVLWFYLETVGLVSVAVIRLGFSS